MSVQLFHMVHQRHICAVKISLLQLSIWKCNKVLHEIKGIT